MDNGTEQDFLLDFLDIEADNQLQKDKLRLKEGERREVTILFADVKNSTVLGSKLDPELFHRKLDELMKRFTRCVTYYGGYVDKYMGDGIMALFGAKKATEQDTERSILAALRMIEQVRLYNSAKTQENQAAEEQIGIRIGINSGLVLVGKVGEAREGDFTVTGAAVHLAQRMEANAPVGKILVPLHTKQAAERFFEFDSFGSVQAKGFAEPVETYSVLKPKLDKDSRWYQRLSVFVGRDAELAVLNNAFSHLERKARGLTDESEEIKVIGLCADAGLGKSRLVHEFTSPLANRALVLAATASGIVKTPFNIFTNLLEHEFKLQLSEDRKTRQEKLEKGFKELVVSLPDSSAQALWDCLPLIGFLLEIPSADARLKQSGPELLAHLKIALKTVFLLLIEQKTKQGKPLILILDDLHWLDESSAAVLAELLQVLLDSRENGVFLPVLIVMQYRQDYAVPDAIAKLESFRQLELKPLSDNEIMRLIRFHTQGRQIPDETLEKVRLLSSGNPFYLEEWCNYLHELPKHELYDLPVPNNLHTLILSRLDLLDSAIRILLQKASVIGHEFLVEILRWMESKLYNPSDLEDTLKNLEQQSFILKLLGFDYSAYFFKHIITRDVAYQTLLLENHKILHSLAAQAIEELYPDRNEEFLFQLADHYHRAENPEKAVFYLEKAALAAKKAYSNKLSIELFEKLLQWKRAKVERWKGETGTPASAGRSAGFSRSETTDPLVPSLSSLIPAKAGTYQDPDPQPLTPTRILLHLTEIKWLIGQWDSSDLDLQQALSFAEQNPQTEELFDCHRLKGISAFQRGNPEQAKTEWEFCLDLADSLNGADKKEVASSERPYVQVDAVPPSTSRLLAIIHGNLGIWYQHHKEYETALHHHLTSLNYAQELNDTLRIAKTLSNLGFMYLTQKDYPNAEKHLSECLAIAEANQYLQLMSIALGNLGVLHYKLGNLDQAMHYYEKKWLLVDKLDDTAELIKVLGNIANVHRDNNQHREALEFYRKVLSIKQTLGNPQELAITQNEITMQLLELGLFSEALAEIDKTIEYSLMGKTIPKNHGEFLYNRACILLDKKDYVMATSAIELAIAYARENKLEAVLNACMELHKSSTIKNES